MSKDPEKLRRALLGVLENFEESLKSDELRDQVLKLVPANILIRKLGISLKGLDDAASARDRILSYMQKYTGEVIHGNELMVVSGISEYARRIRELRVQFGWAIISGMTLRQLRREAEDDNPSEFALLPEMRPDEYMLLTDAQDRDAAHRWQVANQIRKRKTSVQNKILSYLQENLTHPVTTEELRYVAGNKSE